MKAEVLVVELQSVGKLVRGDISRKHFLYSSSRYHIYSLFFPLSRERMVEEDKVRKRLLSS